MSLQITQFNPNQTKSKKGRKRTEPPSASSQPTSSFTFVQSELQPTSIIASSSNPSQLASPMKKPRIIKELESSDKESFHKLMNNLESSTCVTIEEQLEQLKGLQVPFLKAFITSCIKRNPVLNMRGKNKKDFLTAIIDNKKSILQLKNDISNILDKEEFIKANLMSKSRLLTSVPSPDVMLCLGVELENEIVHIASGRVTNMYGNESPIDPKKVRVTIESRVRDSIKYYPRTLETGQIEEWNISHMCIDADRIEPKMNFTQFYNKHQEDSDEVDNTGIFVKKTSSSNSSSIPQVGGNLSTPGVSIPPLQQSNIVQPPPPPLSQATSNSSTIIPTINYNTMNVGGNDGSSSGNNGFLDLLTSNKTVSMDRYSLAAMARMSEKNYQLEQELAAERAGHKYLYQILNNMQTELKKYHSRAKNTVIRLRGKKMMFDATQIQILHEEKRYGMAIRFILETFGFETISMDWKADLENIVDSHCFNVKKCDDQWINFVNNQKKKMPHTKDSFSVKAYTTKKKKGGDDDNV